MKADYILYICAENNKSINMFYIKDNLQTAKTDYIALLALLIKKGCIFEEHKDMPPDVDNYEK